MAHLLARVVAGWLVLACGASASWAKAALPPEMDSTAAAQQVRATDWATAVAAVARGAGLRVCVPDGLPATGLSKAGHLGELAAAMATAAHGRWRTVGKGERRRLVLSADPATMCLAELPTTGGRESPADDGAVSHLANAMALYRSLTEGQREVLSQGGYLSLTELTAAQVQALGLFCDPLPRSWTADDEARASVRWTIFLGAMPLLAYRGDNGYYGPIDTRKDGLLTSADVLRGYSVVLSEEPEPSPPAPDWRTRLATAPAPTRSARVSQTEAVSVEELVSRTDAAVATRIQVTREVAARRLWLTAGAWTDEELLEGLIATRLVDARIVAGEIVLALPAGAPRTRQVCLDWQRCAESWATWCELADSLHPSAYQVRHIPIGALRQPTLLAWRTLAPQVIRWAEEEELAAPAELNAARWADVEAWFAWATKLLDRHADRMAILPLPTIGVRYQTSKTPRPRQTGASVSMFVPWLYSLAHDNLAWPGDAP